ncbi:CRP/FNR family transcriptional regulator, anaerobic regulatory protein [Roseivivax halotolerans]|jgi:CRP/FNR family transcriptional regulator|uniref:CRP/FNR family transcriptional regulator, anaerobic regulatory protein n=1 Tax=Roseivivax halotolerans TaxID=93684 RepID=A0A1I5ZEK4_9RHOB|nr:MULTISPECIES: Crp/Fnr family transcriptional regulator [Roseivivax]QFT63269.1 Nitrogen fixation regulation protein FixK [Roseivivax sp. THAF30]SFQ54929.1 CRP/FNR family transcriptional regulator, anaerobic regulatory protein [Roseivivax halotolerans]
MELKPVNACHDCPIRHSAVCAECDADELKVLERIKSYKTVPAGAHLAEAGREMEFLSSIISGCATMSRTLEDGRRQTVGLLLPSNFIGRPGRASSPYDVEAISEVTLCRFERKAFEDLVRSTPHIATRLMTMALDELDSAREWAVVLGRMSAREKVLSFLVRLARRNAAQMGQDAPEDALTLHLPLSREELADYLGLTIETTSRQFTALRKDGLIELPSNRDVHIPDFDRLAIEAGEDEDGGLIA